MFGGCWAPKRGSAPDLTSKLLTAAGCTSAARFNQQCSSTYIMLPSAARVARRAVPLRAASPRARLPPRRAQRSRRPRKVGLSDELEQRASGAGPSVTTSTQDPRRRCCETQTLDLQIEAARLARGRLVARQLGQGERRDPFQRGVQPLRAHLNCEHDRHLQLHHGQGPRAAAPGHAGHEAAPITAPSAPHGTDPARAPPRRRTRT